MLKLARRLARLVLGQGSGVLARWPMRIDTGREFDRCLLRYREWASIPRELRPPGHISRDGGYVLYDEIDMPTGEGRSCPPPASSP